MAKNYEIYPSEIVGFWAWSCEDGSNGGYARSKKEAKRAAKQNCTGIDCILTPPKADATFIDGYLNTFTVANLDGQSITFTFTEISEEMFIFLFGLTCELPPYPSLDEVERLITIFKIWGIYLKGGTMKSELKTLYNLTELQFQKLITKDYINVQISIDDFNNFTWVFPN